MEVKAMEKKVVLKTILDLIKHPDNNFSEKEENTLILIAYNIDNLFDQMNEIIENKA
jgi:hypothetical protein